MASKLEFRLHKVLCVDEMDGPFGSEAGSDDIVLAGLTIEPEKKSAKTGQIAAFKVGVFDDGSVKTFDPPRRLALFDLKNGAEFPTKFAVTLMLIEQDHGNISKAVSQLESKVKSEVTAALAAAVGAGIGTAGGPIGMAIGAAAGVAVNKAFGELKGLFGDEVFKPQTIDRVIKSADQKFAGGAVPETLVFKGHGATYKVQCDWHLLG